MAKELGEVAANGDNAALLDAIERIAAHYADNLRGHFRHEEEAIFALIVAEYRDDADLVALVTALLEEHQQLRARIAGLTAATARKDLAAIAVMLKGHIHAEERRLFPAVQALFTEEEMEGVLRSRWAQWRHLPPRAECRRC